MASMQETIRIAPSVDTRKRWLTWIRKGGLAITDQGLISGSNFAISILLARWLSSDGYGAYALAFAVFILVSQLHQALLLEPMSVFGGSTHRGRLREYLGTLLWMHGAAALAISAVLGIGAIATFWLHESPALPSALLGVTIASPCILLFWLIRRGFYLEMQPAAATQGAVLYCALVLGLLYVANISGMLSPLVAFSIMGVGALLTSIVFLFKLKPIANRTDNSLYLPAVCKQHWVYGRWALASAVAMWIPTNVYYVLLGSFSGMAHAAELRAVMNLALPVGQTATALSLLFVPYASRARAERGPHALSKIANSVTALYAVGAIAYWAVILVFQHPILHLMYGGRYGSIGTILPIVALSSVFQTCINGPGLGLRADETPVSVFIAYLFASAVTLIGGVAASWFFGVNGALVTMLVSNIVAFTTAQVLFGRNLRRHRHASNSGPESARSAA